MTAGWHSLYLHTDDSTRAATALRAVLEALGYREYDPFPGGTGTPPGLKTFVRQFVAPAQAGWVRVIGEIDPACAAPLSATMPLLHAWLTDTESGLTCYTDGAASADGLIAFLRPNTTPDQVARAQQGATPVIAEKQAEGFASEVEQMARAHNVKPEQAQNLMNRLTGQLFGKMDRQSGGEASAMQDQARALLSGPAKLDWNSPAAQRLKAMIGLTTLPTAWRDPDFAALRDAYQVARRLQKSPTARLLPDEQEALNAVKDAGRYIAVYWGK